MNKRLQQAKSEHFEFLKALGLFDYKRLPASQKFKNEMPDYSSPPRTPLSNALAPGGFKKSVDDYKWKKDRQETAATIKEIEAKAARIAPAYNKGATQYITPAADLKTLGRKV